MLRCEFAVSQGDAGSGCIARPGSVFRGGRPTGLLGERGTVSPAGDLDFSGS
jgi:hypothetical protein